jgi:transcription elongation factor Elf1
MPVVSLNRWWKCESCGQAQEELIKKKRAAVRWDCKHCGNDSLVSTAIIPQPSETNHEYMQCTKCFEKVDKKHKKHPRPEDFAPVLYLDMCVNE